ncbi:MAG TPA: aminopeptidase P family protein [Alphaproteobacteria bacterium]|nr:aminopeptidase P family protein [Alphaproteobacteria bacterium]
MAAPEPAEGDEAWLKLVVESPGSELRQALLALKARIAAAQPPIPPASRTAAADRLTALRGVMAAQGLSGFVVPLSDPHQLENPPACAQRLRWLTGFTGSAGVAVVLAEEAALFVDGRYTLQAQKEVDGALYRQHHIGERPPAEWAAANLASGAKLAYDPWTMTEDEVGRFAAALARRGATLVPVEPNPIDRIWRDRPPAPLSAAVVHDLSFAGVPSAEKRRAIAAELAAQDVAAAVLTLPDSICWLLNVRGGDVACSPLMLAFAILHASGAVDLFVDARKLDARVREHLGPEVTIAPVEAFAAALERLAARKARIEADPATAPAAVFARLAGADIVRAADPCQLPKACKNPTERDGIRAAHERDGAALVRFLAWLEGAVGAGIDELGVAERLLAFRAEGERFRGLSFATIAGEGPNGAVVHYHSTPATNRKLVPGDVFLLDSGAQYWDGTTDVTRTLAVPGAAPSDEAREAFTRVLKGHIALARARFPEGTSGSQLDALARLPLWEAGLDYDHGTGHGVGFHLGVHEGPQRISKVPNRVSLKPGMVVSIEPGYYKTGAFGIRIENLALVTAASSFSEGRPGDGRPMLAFEAVTLAPIDRRLIRVDLLTVEERAWLDAYHTRVRERLTPRLDAMAAAWLARATARL